MINRDDDLASQVTEEFVHLRSAMPYKASVDDIIDQISKLQREVQKLKRDGISMWNYKAAIPRIFDIVDGAFVIMTEMAVKLRGSNE